jgi:molybdopterin molybdotransferase
MAGTDDVRMRGFRRRVSVDEALRVALEGLAPLPLEEVPVTACAGRVLAAPVRSEVDVPSFRRAAMDGYAVRAEDTFGASAYDPVGLQLRGESMPGGEGAPAVAAGGACRIMTGAPVPDGADAVLRAEDAEERDDRVLVRASVPPGKNVGRVGEDVAAGDDLLPAGRVLRPQDVGLLASVGCHPVAVRRRPLVRILVGGNELLAPGERPRGNRIVDSNSPMLAALVERDGGVVEDVRRLPDDQAPIRDALTAPGADVIVASGGSSVGREDYVPVILRAVGELPVHGVAMRPSSPTGIGRVGDARVFLLPGNPVSSLCAYDFFAGPAVRTLAGRSTDWPYTVRELPLATRLVSQIGRTDYARVAVREGGVEPLAVSGASVLSSTTRADGFVIVDAGSEGVPEGGTVRVHLYDPGVRA